MKRILAMLLSVICVLSFTCVSTYLYDVTVGGGYEVDCRQYCTSNNVTGPWTKGISSVKDAAHLGGATRIFAGNEVRLQFSTHFLTPVRVEVNGTWDSN